MKKLLGIAVLTLATMFTMQSVHARDTAVYFPLADVLNSAAAKERLDGSVRFYLAGQKTPNVKERMEVDSSSPKTNGFNKTPQEACHWAALSALISLQKRAKQLGANAVVDIVSNWKHKEYSNPTNFECHDGAFAVGVTLKGTFAKVEPD